MAFAALEHEDSLGRGSRGPLAQPLLFLAACCLLFACSSSSSSAGPDGGARSCASSNGGCDPNATCAEVSGAVTCACNTGYTGSGLSCTAVNSCGLDGGGCDPNATCTSTGPGTNTCACNTGYSGSGTTCTAVDSCQTSSSGCDPNATCTSTGPGTNTCACKPGYSGDGSACVPVNSCLVGNGGCSVNAACTNTGPATNTCVCSPGYSGDGTTCTAVDSCATNSGGCDPNATCTSSGPGTNTCTCNSGYTGPGTSCVIAGGVAINGGAANTSSTAVTLDLFPPGDLLTNANLATGDLTGWTAVSSGGDGPLISPPGLFSGDAYITSYEYDERGQEIDLLAAGLTAAELDGTSQPSLFVLDWAMGTEPNYADDYTLHAELRSAAHTALVSQDSGTQASPVLLSNQWAPEALTFSSYPVGVRYLYIEDGGKDVEYFAGNYGARISNSFAGLSDLQVAVSNDGVVYTAPQPYTSQLAWTLPSTQGLAKVWVQFLDANSALLQTATASIGNCPAGLVVNNGVCVDPQECEDGTAHCDPNATCADSPGAYTCTCNSGYVGPGNVCVTPGGLAINGGAQATTSGAVTLQLQPTGNLLKNSDLSTGDLTDWTALASGGNGPDITTGGLISGDRYIASYDWDARGQEIDLVAAGLDAGTLDGAQAPTFLALDWAEGTGPNVNDDYYLHAELRNAAHTELTSQDDGTEAAPTLLDGAWTPHSFLFSGYGPGVRYLYIADGSKDVEYWAGNYGGALANSYFGVPPAQVAISNDGVTWSALQAYQPQLSWTLAGTGPQTVSVQYYDQAANLLQTLSASIGYCPAGQVILDGVCVDDQECEDSTASCSPNATCTDSPGSFSCACNTGYSGNGLTCTAIDGCTSASACDPNATCSDTGPGTYTCACNTGYTGDGKTCSLITPCNPDPCDPNASCQISGSNHTCACNSGYSGDGTTCTAINACTEDPTICGPTAAAPTLCTSTGPGTFSCTCSGNYYLNGLVCNLNACATGSVECQRNATCTPVGNNVAACDCNPGYAASGTTGCAPINKCLSNPCSPNAKCTDTGPGTYTCACDTGYSGDGTTCTEINACLANPCSPDAACTETGPDTYTCACKTGYSGDGVTCAAINACNAQPCDPHAVCTDTGPGTYTCACDAGFSGDGKTCAPIDACTSGAADCSPDAICTNTGPGTFACTCKSGYTGNGVTCTAG